MAKWIKQVDGRGRVHMFPYHPDLEGMPGYSVVEVDDTPPPPAKIQPEPAHPVAEYVQHPTTERTAGAEEDVVTSSDVCTITMHRPKTFRVKGWKE